MLLFSIAIGALADRLLETLSGRLSCQQSRKEPQHVSRNVIDVAMRAARLLR